MLDEGDHSTPLKSALAGTDFDLRTAAPTVATELRDAVGVLLGRAQRAGATRTDLDIDDLMALLAGAFHAIQYAGVKAKSRQAERLTSVLFDGLRPDQQR
jgi:hypothetical protein